MFKKLILISFQFLILSLCGWSQSAKDFYSIGNSFFKQEKYDLAIQNVNKALKIEKEYFDAYYLRAQCFERIGDNKKAMSDLDKMVSLKPYNFEPYLTRAQFLTRSKEFSLALLDFNKVIELNPNYVFAYLYRGQLFILMDSIENAILDFEIVVKNFPNHLIANENLAKLYFVKQDFTSSIKYSSILIELKPDESSYYVLRGKAFLKQQTKDLACADFQKAKQLGNPEVELLLTENCSEN